MKTREDIIKVYEGWYKEYGSIVVRCPYIGNHSVTCEKCLWTGTKHNCGKDLEELRKIAERRVKLEKLLYKKDVS